MSALLEVEGLVKRYRVARGRFVQAVSDVSFAIEAGEVLALVGESGCGKSTIGRCLVQLERRDAGTIRFDGMRIDTLSPRAFRPLRRRIQMVFQDPYGSLNPRLRVEQIIAEPLVHLGWAGDQRAVRARVFELLDLVHLPRTAAERRPHEFSGGQRQRIGIARALAARPDLLVCDEAVSALDVSVKAQIVNLLADLRAELGLAMLFISHDLAIVEQLADRVAVMYLGKLVEIGDTAQILRNPRHPYTRGLIAAVPRIDGVPPQDALLAGEPPDPAAPPAGCRFHGRCPRALPLCTAEEPPLVPAGAGRKAACHYLEPAQQGPRIPVSELS